MGAMDDAERAQRVDRRRRVVALLRAMQAKDDPKVEELVGELAADPDIRRVIGALGVAGSTMADNVAKTRDRPVEDVLAELEEVLVSAPVE